MGVHESSYQGNPAVVLRADGVLATVLPTPGGKVVSLVDEHTGHEAVWQDPHRHVDSVAPGIDFADADISGIDDCFPTVDACRYPAPPFAGTPIADHGEVWAREWTYRLDGDAVVLQSRGMGLPYLLEKRITLSRRVLRWSYRLRGCTDVALAYQWTAHPLLVVEEGSRILLDGAPSGRVAFSTGGRLMVDAHEWSWPLVPATDGGIVDLSRALPGTSRVNEKVWLTAPTTGVCRLTSPTAGHELELAFDPAQLPWLAVCVNYGGWPTEHPGQWVALEPSMSQWDALMASWRAGTSRCLRPGVEHTWWWSLTLHPVTGRRRPR